MKGKEPKYIKILTRTGMLITAITILGAIYVMIHKMGLVDGLAFGAGSYFYADIPDFYKYVNGTHFTSSVSMGGLIVLFLLWGFLMYRLWIWLDQKL